MSVMAKYRRKIWYGCDEKSGWRREMILPSVW